MGDAMCSPRLDISALSLSVDKLASCGALVIASMDEIRRPIPVVRLLYQTSRHRPTLSRVIESLVMNS